MSLYQGIYDDDYGDEDERPAREPGGFARLPAISPEREAQLRAMPYAQYLLSPEWNAKRAACLVDADYRCETCGKRGKMQVHHLTYQNLPNERRGDLRALCGTCHLSAHAEPMPKTDRRSKVDPRFAAMGMGDWTAQREVDPFRVDVVPFKVKESNR